MKRELALSALMSAFAAGCSSENVQPIESPCTGSSCADAAVDSAVADSERDTDVVPTDAAADAADARPEGSLVPPKRPSASGTGTTKWFAVDVLRLGLSRPDGTPDPKAWELFGYDLDQRTTTKDDSKTSFKSCKRREGSPGSVLADGQLGVDNNFGQHVMSLIKSLKHDVEDVGNAAIGAGMGSLLLRLDNAGPADNASVPGALYLAGALPSPPSFTTADKWPVDARSLTDGATIGNPTANFPGGYMRGGVWVSGDDAAGKAEVELPVAGASLKLKLFGAVITVNVAAGTAGILAGGTTTSDLEAGLRPVAIKYGICPTTPTYQTLVNTVTQSADLVASAPGFQDTSKTCDSISVGLGFTMKPTGTPTEVSPAPSPGVGSCF